MSAAVVTIDAFNHIHNAIMSFIHIFNNDLNELHLEMKEMISDSESELEFESELDLNGLNRLNRRDIDRRDIDSFVANFVSGLNIGIISFSHILFGVVLSFVLSFGFISMIHYIFHYIFNYIIYYAVMVSCYLFNMLWNSLDKGQEWAQLATLMTGFGIYVYIMCYTSYTNNNNNIDKYIYKLKSEIDEKNAIINELQMKLDNKLKMISNDLAKESESESESEDDTVWETESDSDSDSDSE
jgi:hypothetical protein